MTVSHGRNLPAGGRNRDRIILGELSFEHRTDQFGDIVKAGYESYQLSIAFNGSTGVQHGLAVGLEDLGYGDRIDPAGEFHRIPQFWSGLFEGIRFGIQTRLGGPEALAARLNPRHGLQPRSRAHEQ